MDSSASPLPAGAGDPRAAVKAEHMRQLAEWRHLKQREPELRWLFLELTSACNERCLHCGSSCEPGSSPEVPTDLLLRTLERVHVELATPRTMLCITGGEPLLRADFFDLMARAADMGYRWGMTTNGTLITPQVARRLARCGMRTASVSIDGLPQTHDWFRGRVGSYDQAMAGVRNLLDEGSFSHIQVTTVVHKRNIDELDEMFERMDALDLGSWRLTAMEPIGRALDHPELALDAGDLRRMFDFIAQKRLQGAPVTYGCCHYLGLEYERLVRDAYFLCNAGIYVGSIMSDGRIGSCLDIERRDETTFGSVYEDDFVDVWRNRFGTLRRDPAELDARCEGCGDRDFCAGGSWHSFDFNSNRQRMCLKDMVF